MDDLDDDGREPDCVTVDPPVLGPGGHPDQASRFYAEHRQFNRCPTDNCVTADVMMVGVWDTVGSLIGNYDYLETGLRRPILNIFHALAIDEHRFSFKPTLLTRNIHSDQTPANRSKPRPIENVEQRWFVGAHANVGGGYASDPLSQGPLAWIAKKACGLGLKLKNPIKQDDRPWTYPVADSFRDFAFHFYRILFLGIPYHRKVGELDRKKDTLTTENVNETIDQSVFERWRSNRKYRPKNIEIWAKLHNVDPATLATSVLAKDPKLSAPE